MSRRVVVVLAAALALAGCAEAHVQEDPEWHLDRIDQRQLPLDDEYRYALTGEGTRIYVIDDGVHANRDFSARLVTGLQLHGPEPTGDHGTRTAGAAAGNLYGPAKAATVVDVHAYDDPPWDDEMDAQTMRAHEWIVENHPAGTPGVVVDAWGFTPDPDAVGELSASYRSVLGAGLSVVISAANQGEELGADGTLLHVPQEVPGLVVVGATDREDRLWERSNHGPLVDVYAPGHDLTLPSGEGWGTASGTSGTSWSAPIVAGVISQMFEAEPDRSPEEVKEALVAQATEGEIEGLPSGSHNRLVYAPEPTGSWQRAGGLLAGE